MPHQLIDIICAADIVEINGTTIEGMSFNCDPWQFRYDESVMWDVPDGQVTTLDVEGCATIFASRTRYGKDLDKEPVMEQVRLRCFITKPLTEADVTEFNFLVEGGTKPAKEG